MERLRKVPNVKRNKTTKVATWAPLFPGFYESIFQYDHEQNFEGGYDEFDNLSWEEKNRIYREHEQTVGLAWCREIEKRLNVIGITCKMEFEKVYSPKEYNFTTDSLDVTVSFDKEQLLQYMLNNKERLAQYFLNTFTSRDGFRSFYNADIDSWIYGYFGQMKEKPNVLGAILESIIENEPNFSKANLSEEVYYSL